MKTTELKERLDKAEAILKWYANPRNWTESVSGCNTYVYVGQADIEIDKKTYNYIGGKKARKYFG